MHIEESIIFDNKNEVYSEDYRDDTMSCTHRSYIKEYIDNF